MKVFIIIPAYNEEKKIKNTIKSVKRLVDNVIVIDDGSSDDTSEKIKDMGCTVIKHNFNLGQGAALLTGFEYALKKNADIVVTYDADGQFKASEIPLLTQPIISGEVDVVLGSRFLGKTINMSFTRYLILKLGIIFTYLFSGIKLTDTHNGFRAFSKKSINTIKFYQDNMAYASEILDQIKRNNLRFKEVPVTVKYTNYTKKKGQKDINAMRIFFNLIVQKLD